MAEASLHAPKSGQDIRPGPPDEKPPSGGDGRPAMKLRFSVEQDTAIRLAWRARQRSSSVTLTDFVWGIFEASQRKGDAHTPDFLDLTPTAAALHDLADEDERLRKEIMRCAGSLRQCFGMYADDGPALRAHIGAALNKVEAALLAADAACAARGDTFAQLQHELAQAAARVARYAR
jgi:hypothetical protein